MSFEPVSFESGRGAYSSVPRVSVASTGRVTFNKPFVEEFRLKNRLHAHFAYDHKRELLQIRFNNSIAKSSKELKIKEDKILHLSLINMFRKVGVTLPETGTRILVCNSSSKTKLGEGLIFQCSKKWHPERDFDVEEVSLGSSEEPEETEETTTKKKVGKKATKKIAKKKTIRRSSR